MAYVTGALDIVPGALLDGSSKLAYRERPVGAGADESLDILSTYCDKMHGKAQKDKLTRGRSFLVEVSGQAARPARLASWPGLGL